MGFFYTFYHPCAASLRNVAQLPGGFETCLRRLRNRKTDLKQGFAMLRNCQTELKHGCAGCATIKQNRNTLARLCEGVFATKTGESQ
jgi:hypothetical protein